MNRNSKLLGFYNYTVILTYIGMLVGFIGITFALKEKQFTAVLCLMIAGLCDMFDGAVASTRIRTKQEKDFGIQIDSLSDLICFGVLPGLLIYSLNKSSIIALTASCIYTLCALIRLAYFNVSEQERQKESSSPRKIYYGLPVTSSALLIPLAYIINTIFSLKTHFLLSVILFMTAILFLSPFRLKKPKFKARMCILLCGIVELFLLIFTCGAIQ